ncbi:hypothetical protein WR25_15385 [Diploscapter pachys]|uniref:ER membrane protein complex subunit 2 n=1 Tax=Diploscapter pachys TaxID=2018661 RepID=A0A2A2LJS3_9BILA|nr:hypothetical protein WR25_15385 [Diploscapter pachys]
MAPRNGFDWTNVSFEEGMTTLKEWRETGVRRSEEVVEIWEHVLSRSPVSLSDQLWLVYEQVCIAALDASRFDLASECISRLDERFPKSSRVSKLIAMRYEAMENYNAAAEIYEKLIEGDPTNNSYRKRKIAVMLALGHYQDAIRDLNEYLKTFLNDNEAWIQLSELYLHENDIPKAMHCIEELIVSSPLNTLFLNRLADMRYTIGGVENLELAASYYGRATALNPSDLHAQYGLFLCSLNLSNHSKALAEKKKESTAAAGSALERITARYQEILSSQPNNPSAKLNLAALQSAKVKLAK